MKNWFDMESHPSDSLIHYSDYNPNRGKRETDEFRRTVEGIRADYDFVANTQARKLALERLLQHQYEKATADEAESQAGPEL